MNPASEDPARVLSESGQWTERWGSSEDGTRCDECGGRGRTEHECWSCLLTGASASCPVCHGAVRWVGECPVCRGTGRTDGEPRHGVSVFPTVEELEGEPADDIDFDSDQGAMLVIPTAILACEPVDRALVQRIEARGVSG